jgi:formylglycine-generating enzyme required for sulfatase activity
MLIELLKSLEMTWAAIPSEIRNSVNSAAADAATALFNKNKGGEQKQRFEKAYLAGLQGLTVTLQKDCPGLVKPYLDNPKVRGLLLKILDSRSLKDPAHQIIALASELGIDITGDDFKQLEEAVRTFRICFESQALEGADPLQWLIYFKIQSFFSDGQIEPSAADISALRKAYLTHLRDDFERITFKGYAKGKAISIPLIGIFTKPQFDIQDEPHNEQTFAAPEKHKEPKLPVGQVQHHTINTLLQCKLAVVTGGPGAGKSTLLKYLALALADRLLENKDPDVLPIIFPISAYAEKRRKAASGTYNIRAFLSDYWKERFLDDPLPLFEAYWQKGRALFLIDGLDEVADEGERQKMISDVRYLIMATMNGDHLSNRFYITCRSASYEGASQFEQFKHFEFKRFEIKRFNIEQIGHFLFSWYCWYEHDFKNRRATYLKRAKDQRNDMIAVLEDNENICDLATNPLMLTILALIEHEGGQLPQSRAELYSECLRILSGAWENLRSLWKKEKVEFLLGDRKITDTMVIDFLGPVAFAMQDAADKEVDETELTKELAKSFRRRQPDKTIAIDQAREFIVIMRQRSGLLDLVKPQIFGFLHLTFREYLAARWLADFADFTSQLEDRLLKAEWREVVLLMAASLSPKEASRFIAGLVDTNSNRFEHLQLAGECVLDMGRDNIFDHTFDKLTTAMWDTANRTGKLYEKATLAELAGRLGDPRLDLENFVSIPAGRYDLERIGKIELSRFEIGRYPVTNKWFSRFGKEGGYKNQSLWTKRGWLWLQKSQVSAPRWSKDPKYNCPTAPVVGVSWYEAAAFCRWLTIKKKDGYRYFLPTQKQWQAAAAGKNKRKYPWGERWTQGVCNTNESEIDKPSPVGIFVEGRTPVRYLYDMAGNVWEWTGTNHKSEEVVDDFLYDQDRKKQRFAGVPIIKGGAWNDPADVAVCASRYIGGPDDRLNFVGFRCARTKII